ncbi:unnamed protein product [Blepharisma stoltei]|uniref:Uncharacterized protein n=1 Tax=Blepharisma stoltei TaxID=1481888 RepID=A0AAU9K8F9_9CILI|nr:unnamed protein product [Blepharisma stoltei]
MSEIQTNPSPIYNSDAKAIKYFHHARGNAGKLELNVDLISEESERKEVDSLPSEPQNEFSTQKSPKAEASSTGIEDKNSEQSYHKTASLDYSFSEDPSNLTYRISDSASGFNNSLAERFPKFTTASLTLSESSSMPPSNDLNFRSSLIEYRESIGQDSNPFDIMVTEEEEHSDDTNFGKIDIETPVKSPEGEKLVLQQIKQQLNLKDINLIIINDEVSGDDLEDSDYMPQNNDKKLDDSFKMMNSRIIKYNTESNEESKNNTLQLEDRGHSCGCNLCIIF